MAIYCSNCGASLPDGVAFCDSCGTPVRGQQQPSGAATVGASHGSPLQPVQPPEPAQQAGGGAGAVSCPVCGAAALPGEAFCDNCGAALLAPTAYVSPSQVSTPSSQRQVGAPPSYSSAPMGSSPGYAPATSRQVTASLVVTSPPP